MSGYATCVGGRLNDIGFITFENEAQFAPQAEMMASRAAQEVRDLRKRFHSLAAIVQFFETASPSKDRWSLDFDGWSRFDAAVAHGLVGNVARSKELFAQLLARPVDFESQREQRTAAAYLSSRLDDLSAYRVAVQDRIAANRKLHALPPASDCLLRAI